MEVDEQIHVCIRGQLKKVIYCIGVFLILVSVSIPLVIYFFHIVPTRMCTEETNIFLPTFNCTGDDFSELKYLVNDTCLNSKTRYLKYKLIDDSENYQFYNYSSAYEECQRLNASMWEVLDGAPEWDVVIENIKKFDRSNVWLNAKPIEKCPESEDEAKSCRHNDALMGNGLGVQWPSTKYISPTYSRLIRGISLNEDNECVFVDKNNEDIWDVQSCSAQRYWGLCVKRNCFPSDYVH